MNCKFQSFLTLMCLIIQVSSCTLPAPEMDKKFYSADEISGMQLLKQKNCHAYPHGNYIESWDIVCDMINPFIYFTKDKKTFTGKAKINYYSNDTKCQLFCVGEIAQGYKLGEWHFIANAKKFEISGYFQAKKDSSGNIEETYCSGEWIIKNNRDSICYTIKFENDSEEVQLRKMRFKNVDSVLTVQTIFNISNDAINVSPFSDNGNNLNYNSEPDFEDDTRKYCITDYSKKHIRYMSRSFSLELYNNKLAYLKYYSDSLNTDVSLLFDTLKNQITDVIIYENRSNEKRFFKDKKKSKGGDSFISYEENGDKERLSTNQFLQYNLDSLIYVAKIYCK